MLVERCDRSLVESLVGVGRLVSGFWLVPFFSRTKEVSTYKTARRGSHSQAEVWESPSDVRISSGSVEQVQKTSGSDDWHDGAAFKLRHGTAPIP